MVEKTVQWELHNTCDSALLDIRRSKLRCLKLSGIVDRVGETRSAEGV
jgi:hypothetical protein